MLRRMSPPPFAPTPARRRSERPARVALLGIVLAILLSAGLVSASPALAEGTASAPATPAPPAPEVGEGAPAVTQPIPTPTPTPTTEPGVTPTPTPSPSEDVDTPPVITAPASGAFSPDGTVTVRGTAAAGARVHILREGGWDPLCTVSAEADGRFSCTVSGLLSGPSTALRAAIITADGRTLHSESLRVAVLTAPTITASNRPGIGIIAGTGYPGATIRLSSPALGEPLSAEVGPGGDWAVALGDRATTGSFDFTATQRITFDREVTSAASPATRIEIDVRVPTAPTITSPRSGAALPATGMRVEGTGTDGHEVELFIGDDAGREAQLCTVPVRAGRWSCDIGPTDETGRFTLIALQRNGVGTVGPASAGVELVSTATPGVRPTPSPSATPAPVPTPSPSDSALVPPPSTAEPEPSPTDPPPTAGGGAPGGGEGPGGASGDLSRSPFVEAIALSGSPEAAVVPLRVLLLGGAVLLLVLVPTLLVAGRVQRQRPRAARFTGRNRAIADFESAPLLVRPGGRATLVAAVLAAATALLFCYPTSGLAPTLRSAIASLGAVVLLHAIVLGTAMITARRLGAGPVQLRPSPVFLGLVIVSMLLARWSGMQPALLAGLALTGVLCSVVARRVQAQVAASAILAALGAGGIGWTVAALLPRDGGALTTGLAEAGAILAMAGIGSALIAVLPLGRLPGRFLAAGARGLWFVLATLVALVAASFLAPALDSWRWSIPPVAILAAMGVFAAIALSVRIWRSAVRPLL